MPKFTVEDKLGAVNRYQLGIESINSIAKSVGTARSNLLNWIKQYETNGIEAFVKSYTSYSLEFKLDVLNYMNETGTSSINTAALFNISSPGMIRNWKMKFEVGGYDALISKKKGRPSMDK
ncbi:helix-turn-helix domain-containing protein [Viridibacillus arvi]|uniref:helix-turn-helix domain-containing protein n=1 Tax=Viridibacillus arvi TaxID=263475 RepID=UPI000ACA8FF3|nr:helix-turn-helix domain-containing protein [Viridibacillus arvi]